MKEDKEKTTKIKTASSKVQDKKGKSSDELLEEILNKKKTKKSPKKVEVQTKEENETISEAKSTEKTKTAKKSPTKSKTATKKGTKKAKTNKEKAELSADELLENIIAKKEKKVAKKTTKKTTSENEKIEKNQVTEEKTASNEEQTSKELEKQEVQEEKETSSDLEEKSTPKKNQDDLIITRKITFDDEKINLKSKKTLQELRKAIEEFDRLETLSEIANSSDKINDLKEDNTLTDDLDNAEELTVVEENQESEKRDLFKTSMLVLDSRFDRLYSRDEEEDPSLDEQEEDSAEENTDELNYLNLFGGFEPEEVRPRLKKRSYFDKDEINGIILVVFVILLFVFLLFILFTYIGEKGISNANTVKPEVKEIISTEDTDKKELEYQNCLTSEVPESIALSGEIVSSIAELRTYIEENYKASILYKDLTTGFTFTHKEDSVYYAASTIKVLDGLYIYTKAANGELNLDDKLEYTAKYQAKSSKGMSQYKYGEQVSLRNLVKYAIVYSDNSAHYMLINYIGKKNLQEFGKSLGAGYTLVGSDEFGSIDVKDALVYMNAVNNFINNTPILGEELKSYLVTAEQNDLEMKDLNIEAAHKFGNYENYYHDYGIVYDKHPYIVAILTTEGKGDYEAKVRDISRHIYAFHQAYYKYREQTCKSEVYNN